LWGKRISTAKPALHRCKAVQKPEQRYSAHATHSIKHTDKKIDLAKNVISIAPLISLVAIAVTFGQANLINGAAFIK
jgi:hypothetical protein